MEAFDVNRVDLVSQNRTQWVEQWHVRSLPGDVHPLHIHVNPHQVQSVPNSSFADGDTSVEWWGDVQNLRWRDTVMLGSASDVTLRMRMKAGYNGAVFSGKAVFHCHFLDHEDQGMMQTMFLSSDRDALLSRVDKQGFLIPHDDSATPLSHAAAIALITMGSLFLVIAVVLLALLWRRRQQQRHTLSPVPISEPQEPGEYEMAPQAPIGRSLAVSKV